MACYSNEEVRKAKEQYDKITADKTLMSLIIAAEIDEMDERTRMANAEEKGIERGMAKGMAKGMEEGKKEANRETAKRMLEMGLEIEIIEKATGLTKDEILGIQAKE